MIVGRLRRLDESLGQENANDTFGGIDVRRRAVAAIPPEAAGRLKEFLALNRHAHAEAPAAVAPKEDLLTSALLRRHMIHRHQLDAGT